MKKSVFLSANSSTNLSKFITIHLELHTTTWTAIGGAVQVNLRPVEGLEVDSNGIQHQNFFFYNPISCDGHDGVRYVLRDIGTVGKTETEVTWLSTYEGSFVFFVFFPSFPSCLRCCGQLIRMSWLNNFNPHL